MMAKRLSKISKITKTKKTIKKIKASSAKPLFCFDIITALPESFDYLKTSLIGRAVKRGLIRIKIWSLRDFAQDARKTIDDRPFGGGPGMVLKVEPLYRALTQAKKIAPKRKKLVILTSLAGQQLNQKLINKLSLEKQLIIICGHYEGVDERIKKFIDMEISLGPYVLSGGEIAAMAIIDSVSRHLPGFLHNPDSLEEKRGGGKLISWPVLTKPRIFKVKGKELKVPKVLLSGDHKKIQFWRGKKSKEIKL